MKATKVIDFLFCSFVFWLAEITAAGLLVYLAAITLRAAAAEHDANLTRILIFAFTL